MILLKLKAGLGNQMFQYAYARALELRSEKAFGMKIPLKFDLSWFSNQMPDREPERFYGLNHFNIQADIADEKEIQKNFGYTRSPAYKLLVKILRKTQRDVFGFSDYVYYPRMAKPVKKAYIDSYYWNSEAYFKDAEDIIRREFTLKEPLGEAALSAAKDIQATKDTGDIPVLLTVRRGDYATNVHISAHHGTKEASWYDTAILEMETRLASAGIHGQSVFWVTTDDIAWVKENIKPKDAAGNPLPLRFLSRPGMKDYEEIHIMSLCSHFIIANSTFHWWGAWLSANKEKIVIGPKKWVNNPKIDTKDVLPEGWIRI